MEKGLLGMSTVFGLVDGWCVMFFFKIGSIGGGSLFVILFLIY